MSEHSGLQILELEITNKCNLDCKHCYVDKKNPKTMDKKTLFRLIDEANQLEPHDLIFTGGEPLLEKELLFEAVNYAKGKSFKRIGLLTNGLLIDDNLADQLKIFDIIQLSIDDVSYQEGKGYRPNYLSKLDSVLKFLKGKNIPLKIQCTINKSNLKNFSKILEYAKSLEIPIGFNRTSPVGSACSLDRKVILQKEELKEALELINSNLDPIMVKCSDPLTVLINKDKKDFTLESKKCICGGCTAGIAGCYVSVEGEVYACALLRVSVANINKESLVNIWNDNAIFCKLRNRNNLKGKCNTCKFRAGCGGCRATANGLTGDMFEEDSFCWI